MTEELLKPSEVAKILKISPRTVLNLVNSGRLKSLVISGRVRKNYRIRMSAVNEYIEKNYSE